MPKLPPEPFRRQNLDFAEELLIRTAIRLELPPSLHKLAIERYIAIRTHIERDGSPLKGRVTLFYPQGSMAIRATIRTPWRDKGFDIDIVVELILPIGTDPSVVLDLLYQAIRGEKGSRYYACTQRQTRCVTVHYADGMQLDVTPSILLNQNNPRISNIFHAKPEEPRAAHYRVTINSFAFVEHVRAKTPVDLDFERRYAREVKRHAQKMFEMKADADVVEVPSHSSEDGGKSATIVALQLLKGYRDERYRTRRGKRMPPSVMMTKFAADCAIPGMSVMQALDIISAHTLDVLNTADRQGQKVDVRNPTCDSDRFTDRWPENLDSQRQFIRDLVSFRHQLELLKSGNLSLEQYRDLLAQMFGVGPAQSAIDDIAETLGDAIQSGRQSYTGALGGVRTAAAAVVSPKIVSPRTPNHTFYGTLWPKHRKL